MINIALTVENIREIKDYANREFMTRSPPKELDGPEFLVLCYAMATERVLVKLGAPINAKYANRLPYESIDE